MRSTFSLPVAVAAIWLLAFSAVNAHTWVEKVYRIASNGTFVDPAGYPRNFIPRTQAFNETDALNQIPVAGQEVTEQTLMCKGTKGVQPAGYPSLAAAPKDIVALTYEENGHVTGFTTKAGKPAGRGTVFVYGTTQSLPTDTYLGIHRVWNTEGTGGDKRGKLIAVQPFDDGRCFQAQSGKGQTTTDAERQAAINFPPNTELPCQTDVTLPTDIGTSGTYSLYWVWEWPTLYSNGAIQTNESYTSCIDINLTSQPVAPAGNFIAAQVSGTSALSAGVSSRMATPILINPSAPPQVTTDDPNPAPVPPTALAPTQIATQVPTQAPAAATSPAAVSPAAASPAAASPAATNSANANQGGKMVTVTVTEQQISTMTVTEVVPIVSSIASHPSSASSSVVIVTGKPVVTPFLAPTKRAVTVRGRPVMV